MTKKESKTFSVIVDTREKSPWPLISGDVNQIINKKLDTGDYAVVGLEDKLCIERKASVVEISNNIVQDRFYNELERMREIPYRYIICEFPMEDVLRYPDSANLKPAVKKRIRINGKFLMRKLSEIQIEYGVNIIYCGTPSAANYMALSLMKQVYNKYGSPESTV